MPDPDFRALCAELLQLELEQPAARLANPTQDSQ
jgi:hypothetical protein